MDITLEYKLEAKDGKKPWHNLRISMYSYEYAQLVKDRYKIMKWCSENIKGEYHSLITGSDYPGVGDQYQWCFRSIEDAMAFKMRWS